jgi:hypothetical protein
VRIIDIPAEIDRQEHRLLTPHWHAEQGYVIAADVDDVTW